MTRILVIFLDGVGLGGGDLERNPFAAANMPCLIDLLGGRRLLRVSAPFEGSHAILLPLDACMSVEGKPQSATGQASLLTGRNVPAEVGGHYGPKPNTAIADILMQDNIFSMVKRQGGNAALLNAYPPRYYESIESGRRMYSAIPLAATAAGLELRTAQDLQRGLAISADFTGAGWAAQSDFPPAPVYSSSDAGALLAKLSCDYELAWFDYWPSDYAGHRASFPQAVSLLESFDDVLGGLIQAWGDRQDLIVITSDHGNLEDLHTRGHTRNPVPAMLIGPYDERQKFARNLEDLTGITTAIMRSLYGELDQTP